MAEPDAKRTSPLWIRITLFVSLAVNLLIAGMVAGFFISGGPEKRVDRGPVDAGSVFTRALEPEDRRALRKDFVSGLKTQGRDRSGVLTDVQAALETLRATPFDPEAFNQTMSVQSERREQRERIGRDALTARIAAMSDAERAAYSDRVEKGLADLAKRIRR